MSKFQNLLKRLREQKKWPPKRPAEAPRSDHLRATVQPLRRRAGSALRKQNGLGSNPNILAEFARAISAMGVVGEERNAQLLYLAMTSRLLAEPVSIAVKGQSGGGKSFLVNSVAEFFPDAAQMKVSAMSKRALAFIDEPLTHRMLIVSEATAIEGENDSYLMRTLLSEHFIEYKTVSGGKPKHIQLPGPTGLIITTTGSLHPENETRVLSLHIRDTPDQTRAVLMAHASQHGQRKTPPARWLRLQEELSTRAPLVSIPYSEALPSLIPDGPVRLRRDFRAVLGLIKAHALLHHKTRRRSNKGEIVADMIDYSVVHGLVADVISEGIDASVPDSIRETVDAVKGLLSAQASVSATDLAVALRLHKSTVSRRVDEAVRLGFLSKQFAKSGAAAPISLANPMPKDVPILPSPKALRKKCHALARERQGS